MNLLIFTDAPITCLWRSLAHHTKILQLQARLKLFSDWEKQNSHLHKHLKQLKCKEWSSTCCYCVIAYTERQLVAFYRSHSKKSEHGGIRNLSGEFQVKIIPLQIIVSPPCGFISRVLIRSKFKSTSSFKASAITQRNAVTFTKHWQFSLSRVVCQHCFIYSVNRWIAKLFQLQRFQLVRIIGKKETRDEKWSREFNAPKFEIETIETAW